MMSHDDGLRSLSLDFLNLLINGQAFSDVTFSVEGRLVHAHRCILAARSLFFRKFFCAPETLPVPGLGLHLDHHHLGPRSPAAASPPSGSSGVVIPVTSVGYEVFMLLLQFLYSGLVPQKHEHRPNCPDRACWHTHCTAAVDLALHTLDVARSFGVEQLAWLMQKQLAGMMEKASMEDVMKVLLAMASRKEEETNQLWVTCSHLVAKSGVPPEVLAKHLPIEVVAKIEELRLKSTLARRSSSAADIECHHHKITRMRRALDASDVELVKLMVLGEGLNLDGAHALHYAVENCTREVVKALLELGAADVNSPAGPACKTPLHMAAEMVSPDMVAVLLDHHADPNVRTADGVTPLDILRGLTSDFLFKGAVTGIPHVEPNKLRLCLELVQSATMVLSREETGNKYNADIFPGINTDPSNCSANNLDSRMVYLNLCMAPATPLGGKMNQEDDDRPHRSGGIGPSSNHTYY